MRKASALTCVNEAKACCADLYWAVMRKTRREIFTEMLCKTARTAVLRRLHLPHPGAAAATVLILGLQLLQLGLGWIL